MSLVRTIDAMVAAGCTPEQIAAVVRAHEEAREEKAVERRAKDAERQRRSRMSRHVTVTPRDGCDTPPKVSPHTPLPNPSRDIPPSPPKGGSSPAEFTEFWSLYPHKVGKRDAVTAFAKARKRASFDAIMDGLRRYVVKTDDRPWCNPATWLNQDRWEDMPATVPRAPSTDPPRRHVPTLSTQAQAPPKDQRKPRNAGELSRMQLQAMEGNNAPDFPTGYLNASDGNADPPGTGIARRFAIASSR